MRKAAGGSIVNVSSIWGHRGRAHLADYVASKAALASFSKSMSLALISDRIRVNCVCAGRIETPLWHRAAREFTDGSSEKMSSFLKRHSDVIPIGRFGRAEEVANVVAFLCRTRPASLWVPLGMWTVAKRRTASNRLRLALGIHKTESDLVVQRVLPASRSGLQSLLHPLVEPGPRAVGRARAALRVAYRWQWREEVVD